MYIFPQSSQAKMASLWFGYSQWGFQSNLHQTMGIILNSYLSFKPPLKLSNVPCPSSDSVIFDLNSQTYIKSIPAYSCSSCGPTATTVALHLSPLQLPPLPKCPPCFHVGIISFLNPTILPISYPILLGTICKNLKILIYRSHIYSYRRKSENYTMDKGIF